MTDPLFESAPSVLVACPWCDGPTEIDERRNRYCCDEPPGCGWWQCPHGHPQADWCAQGCNL